MLEQEVLSTLLYYDIFRHPLTSGEVFSFLPVNSVTAADVHAALAASVHAGLVHEAGGYYALRPDVRDLADRRCAMERYAQRHWRVARLMTHVIKRCPFVRAVFVTGTLGKNLSAPDLDIDFFIITAPARLWIARTLLILFKYVFLLGSRKYFCLNYFITEDALEIPDRNIFTATEVALAKVLHNTALFEKWIAANGWIAEYFPNWRLEQMLRVPVNNRRSMFARIMELPLRGRLGDALDLALMRRWSSVWAHRYPDLAPQKRDDLFRVRRSVSKAHGPDFQTRILAAFGERCDAHHIDPSALHRHGPHPART